MYFISKLFWFFVQPVNIMFAVLTLGTLLLFTRFQLLGRRIVVAGLTFGLLIAHFPVSQILMIPLENRFPRPDLPPDITGIISLGGGFELEVSEARNAVEIGSASDRINESILLSRRFPNAKLIYTGGTSNVFYNSAFSGNSVRDYFISFGVDPQRLVIEAQSRNTHENAVLTRDLVNPTRDQPYVLVTSAFHMPRSIGVFRAAGWNVIPWPVDYRTKGNYELHRVFYNAILYLENTSLAAKEWFGLFGYWLGGLTADFFPAPSLPPKGAS